MLKWLEKLICIGTLGLAVYSGFQFGMPYYKYNVFKSNAEEIIRFTVEKDAQMREQLMKKAKELRLPITDENLELSKEGENYRAKVRWSETVNIFDFYKKQLDFVVEVKG